MAFLWRLLPVCFAAGAMDRLTAFGVCIIRDDARMEWMPRISSLFSKQRLRFWNGNFIAKGRSSKLNVASCDRFRSL